MYNKTAVVTVVPDLCVWGVHMSQHFVRVPVVLKAPI